MADQLTRLLCLALRHKPELFGITIDRDGWTDLESLAIGAMSRLPALALSEASIRNHFTNQEEERFELRGDRVRALYGHSLSHVSIGTPANPPPLLFHATRSLLLPKIRTEGLISRGRTGVHLTSRWDYAAAIRDSHTRRGQRGVILGIKCEETRFKGILFQQATSHIWLSPYLPPRFIYQVSPTDGPKPTRTFVPVDSNEGRAILQANLTLFSDD